MKRSTLYLAPSLALRSVAVTGAFALAAALTGCSMGTAPTNDVTASAALNGSVHGGQQPISGATIQLYSVGTTGYGTGATPLLTSAVTTDSGGNFSITNKYTCSTSTLVYITATGGNPGLGTGTNPNSKLMAALGTCGTLNSNTFITMNEVTTAAAAFALTPYFSNTISATSTDSFGAPNTVQAQIGITNAFTTAATLANFSTGGANTTLTTNGAGGTITITPESAKLYTIADILAACINSAGGAGTGDTAPRTAAPSSPIPAPTGVTPGQHPPGRRAAQPQPHQQRTPTARPTTSPRSYGIISATPPLHHADQPAHRLDRRRAQYTGTTATMYEPQSLAIDSAPATSGSSTTAAP